MFCHERDPVDSPRMRFAVRPSLNAALIEGKNFVSENNAFQDKICSYPLSAQR